MKNRPMRCEPFFHMVACPYGWERRAWVRWVLDDIEPIVLMDQSGQVQGVLQQGVVGFQLLGISRWQIGKARPIVRWMARTKRLRSRQLES
eukprot:6488345-Amphidinium_carterae.1